MKKRKLKKSVKMFFACIFAGVLIATTTITILALGNSSIIVENFIDNTKKDVESWRKENHLDSDRVIYSYSYSEEKKENVVLEQSLHKGEALTKNDVLKITLSKGADPDMDFTLPDFAGKTETEIEQWFQDMKFTNVTYQYEVNEEIPESTFISMDPVSGTSVKRSDAIIVKISAPKDAAEITVPDLLSYSKTNIQAWAQENKITVIFQEENNDSIEKGKVISVSCESGSVIHQGDTITVILSKGKSNTEVNTQSASDNQTVNSDKTPTSASGNTQKNESVSSEPSGGTNPRNDTNKSEGNINVVQPTVPEATPAPTPTPTPAPTPTPVVMPDINMSFYNNLSTSEILSYVQEDTGFSAVAGSIYADASSNPNNVSGILSYTKSNGTYILTIAQKWN